MIDLAIEPHGVKLTKREAFGLAAITRFSNQFSPSYVGATIRATYMKRTHGISVAKFSSSFIISNLLQFMISGLLTIATFLALDPSSRHDGLLYVVCGFVLAFIALIYLPIGFIKKFIDKLERRGRRTKMVAERIGVLLDSYSTVRSHPKLLTNTMLWMLVTTFSFGIDYFLLYSALGFHISIVGALFIASLSGWSILIAITPGSLGIREGLMILAAKIAGVSLSATLLVAILLRIIMFLTSGALSAYYSPRLLHTSLFSLGSMAGESDKNNYQLGNEQCFGSHKHVDFFIVGEPKSGTTALAEFLGQHPDISMPSHKEPHHFCTDSIRESDEFHNGKQRYFHVRTEKQYHELFRKNKKIWGEASTGYLYSKEAAANIQRYNPNAKIIVMLRNPVDFIHSLHMQYVNETTENIINFSEALEAEVGRKADWSTLSKNVRCPSYLYYSERVKYAEQIKRFLDQFSHEQVLILTNEEFKNDNASTYQKVAQFLDLDKHFTPKFKTVHASKVPRISVVNHAVHNPTLKTYLYKVLGSKAYTNVHRYVNKHLLRIESREEMPIELRKKLYKTYQPEIKKVSKLLNTNFGSLWKN